MTQRNFSFEVFFSYGFRPFFLFGCLFAALSMAAWLAWIGIHAANGEILRPTIATAPHEWHAHEMLFGYTMAMIAGFFLTAVPNWTGAKPVSGPTLMVLVTAWVAGRLVVWFSAHLPAALVAAVDLAFIPLLLVLVTKSLMKRWAPRNFVFVPILSILFAANFVIHAEWAGLLDDGGRAALGAAVNAVVLLIVIVGGRVVPAFTTNALRNAGHKTLPVSRAPLDVASIVLVAALIPIEAFDAGSGLALGVAGTATLANAIRFLSWRGWATRGQPIVWVLHLAYAWVVVGLALKTAAFADLLSPTSALHALTVGAIGTMTLAVMSRASLGHTGRVLVAPGAVVLAYVLVNLSALVRVAVPILAPAYYNHGMIASGLLWLATYVLVSISYWPILTLPRPRENSGD
jgi:uncharacterized protein involved in response to NO